MLARRLAVFPAGATLAAAEQVCADELLPAGRGAARPCPVLSTSRSWPWSRARTALAPRYRMLETVRAYGLERLAEAGEEAAVRDAFAALLPRPGRDRGSGCCAAGAGALAA